LAVSVYLDASILVSLFIIDSQTARADRFLRSGPGAIVVSDFAAAEFAAVVGRKTRTGDLDVDEREAVFADFDIWTRQTVRIAGTTANDIATAISFLRRRDLTLRAPDAINIALSQRLGTALATFDQRMARDAEIVGVATISV
jgi:predicted nucleic acid-binding protein